MLTKHQSKFLIVLSVLIIISVLWLQFFSDVVASHRMVENTVQMEVIEDHFTDSSKTLILKDKDDQRYITKFSLDQKPATWVKGDHVVTHPHNLSVLNEQFKANRIAGVVAFVSLVMAFTMWVVCVLLKDSLRDCSR